MADGSAVPSFLQSAYKDPFNNLRVLIDIGSNDLYANGVYVFNLEITMNDDLATTNNDLQLTLVVESPCETAVPNYLGGLVPFEAFRNVTIVADTLAE